MIEAMALGPNQMIPQGAKGLVSGLFSGGRRGGVEVSAVLDESAKPPSVEFLSEGSRTAVAVQYAWETPDGGLEAHWVGDLAAGATYSARLRVGLSPQQPLRFVWWCQDAKGRAHAWNYDGRSKRLRDDDAATADAVFRALYP